LTVLQIIMVWRAPAEHASKACAPSVLLFLLGLCSACASTDEGTLFKVTAALADSTCGTGAADAKDNWTFEIRLKKDNTTLTWYDVTNGTSTDGTISDDKFAVSDTNEYVVTSASATSVGCTVRRHDSYTGTATLDKTGTITKLEGDIVFKYSQVTGYYCDPLIGATEGFDDLPCEVDYTFAAVTE